MQMSNYTEIYFLVPNWQNVILVWEIIWPRFGVKPMPKPVIADITFLLNI